MGDGVVTDDLMEEDGADEPVAKTRPRHARHALNRFLIRGLDAAGALFMAERDRWPLWLPVGVGGGVAVYFALPQEPPAWTGLLAVGGVGSAMWLLRRRWAAVIVLTALLALALGFAVVQARTLMVAAPILTRDLGPSMVTGRVLSVERQPAGARMILSDVAVERLKPDATPARIRVRLPARFRPPDAGTVIRLRASLHPPAPPAEPGAFDFQRRAFFQGLGAVGFALSAPEVQAAPPVSGWDVVSVAFDRARAVIAERVQRAIPDPVEASVTAALLNGEEVAIPDPVMDAFRNSGLAHLLSISGLHVGIAAGIVFGVVRALLALVPWIALRWPIKKIAAGCGILSAIAYTMLVGAPVPTVRSVLSTGLIMGAIILDRSPISMRLVAFAGIVTVMMDPEGMLGPSFQMSFAAVAALIAVFEVINPVLARWRKDAGLLTRGLLELGGIAFTSVVATAATTPYSLYHFQQVAFYGVLSNMIAIPVTSVWVMPWSLLAYLLMPFGLEAPALIAMNWGDRLVIWTAELFAGLPGASLLVPAMPAWGFGAVTLGGLWMVIWSGRWRWMGMAAVAVGMATPFVTPRPDLLVSGDGSVMAVRSDEGRLVLSGRMDSHIADTWVHRDGLDGHGGVWPDAGVSLDGRLRCDAIGCVYRNRGRTVALLRLPDAGPDDCRMADVVISAAPLRGCRAPLVIDRWRLRREGAQAIHLSPDGATVRSVRDARGDRPWTRGR